MSIFCCFTALIVSSILLETFCTRACDACASFFFLSCNAFLRMASSYSSESLELSASSLLLSCLAMLPIRSCSKSSPLLISSNTLSFLLMEALLKESELFESSLVFLLCASCSFCSLLSLLAAYRSAFLCFLSSYWARESLSISSLS